LVLFADFRNCPYEDVARLVGFAGVSDREGADSSSDGRNCGEIFSNQLQAAPAGFRAACCGTEFSAAGG